MWPTSKTNVSERNVTTWYIPTRFGWVYGPHPKTNNMTNVKEQGWYSIELEKNSMTFHDFLIEKIYYFSWLGLIYLYDFPWLIAIPCVYNLVWHVYICLSASVVSSNVVFSLVQIEIMIIDLINGVYKIFEIKLVWHCRTNVGSIEDFYCIFRTIQQK